jgi:hypothetical protein
MLTTIGGLGVWLVFLAIMCALVYELFCSITDTEGGRRPFLVIMGIGTLGVAIILGAILVALLLQLIRS